MTLVPLPILQSPRRLRSASTHVAVVIAFAATITACGGGSDASPTAEPSTPVESATPAPSTTAVVATTDAAPDTTTPTTAPPDTTPPTTAAPAPTTTATDGLPPTVDELSTILPTAAEVGPGFELVANPTPVAEDARIFDEDSLVACPAFADLLLGSDDPETVSTKAQFKDPANSRVVSVEIGPEPATGDPAAAQAETDELIAAIEACPLIVGEVADIGIYTAHPSVERVEGLGDQAIRITIDGDLVNDALLVSIDFLITFWERGGVSVAVAGTSGLDNASEAVPNDAAALDALAATIDGRLAAMLG